MILACMVYTHTPIMHATSAVHSLFSVCMCVQYMFVFEHAQSMYNQCNATSDEIPIEDYPPLTTHSQQHSFQYCKISICAQRMRLRYTTSQKSSTTHAKVHTIIALHHRLSPPCMQDDNSNLYIFSVVTDHLSA